MSKSDSIDPANAILNAIRAKREGKKVVEGDIDQMEARLLADLATFDLDAQQRKAQQEHVADTGVHGSSLAFPDLASVAPVFRPSVEKPNLAQPTSAPKPAAPQAAPSVSLLDQLKVQAAKRQQEMTHQQTQRNSVNEFLDQALKQLFAYTHDLYQQLNIVKPPIPRSYSIGEVLSVEGFSWVEGFADYRNTPQASGAMVELVSMSYQVRAPGHVTIERDGAWVERFRAQLFDYGLQFACKEFKNERRYVERAEFQITPQLTVNARWRADFDQGNIVLDTRNLERLGSVPYVIRPQAMDQALFEEFGRLMLGQPNRFRDLARR